MGSEDGPSGVVKIICRSGMLMGNNCKPMIVILLSFLLPRYVLFHAYMINNNNLGLKLLKVFAMSRTMDPATIPGILLETIRTFVLPNSAITAALFLFSSLLSLTVICTVNISLKGGKITLKSMLIEIREKLRSVLVTKLYGRFLSLGYISFSLSIILAVLLLGSISVVFYFLAALMAISSLVLFVYLDFVWFQGVVVSIMETDCEGLAALGKSTAVVKGRKTLAFWLNCLLLLLLTLVGFQYSLVLNKLVTGEKGLIVVEFIVSGMTLSAVVFCLVVHALFYEECRSKPVEELGMQDKILYSEILFPPKLGGFNLKKANSRGTYPFV